MHVNIMLDGLEKQQNIATSIRQSGLFVISWEERELGLDFGTLVSERDRKFSFAGRHGKRLHVCKRLLSVWRWKQSMCLSLMTQLRAITWRIFRVGPWVPLRGTRPRNLHSGILLGARKASQPGIGNYESIHQSICHGGDRHQCHSVTSFLGFEGVGWSS